MLVLSPRASMAGCDLSPVLPELLASLSLAEIERLPIRLGRNTVPLAELCTLEGDASDAHLHLEGDWSAVQYIGCGMTAGQLTVHSSAGDHLGESMSGGTLKVQGNAGHFVGRGMADGQISIAGSAGDQLGGALPGENHGMRGGIVLVAGSAGNSVGCRMRRGTIAVAGAVGDQAGESMRAGTILTLGGFGSNPGIGMRRGTLAGPCQVSTSDVVGMNAIDDQLLPTFLRDCVYQPSFLTLYFRTLEKLGLPIPAHFDRRPTVVRYRGDFREFGKGEVLLWTAA